MLFEVDTNLRQEKGWKNRTHVKIPGKEQKGMITLLKIIDNHPS
jgi:hypothetical protein